MKNKQLRISTLVIGSILACAIAFSHYAIPDRSAETEKTKTEQSQDNADKETGYFISLPSFSLPTPVHVQQNLSPYCLFEILFEADADENQDGDGMLLPHRFFQTMFRVIISPNAP